MILYLISDPTTCNSHDGCETKLLGVVGEGGENLLLARG